MGSIVRIPKDAIGDLEVGLPKLAGRSSNGLHSPFVQRCSFVVPCGVLEQYMVSRPTCRFRASWSSTHS